MTRAGATHLYALFQINELVIRAYGPAIHFNFVKHPNAFAIVHRAACYGQSPTAAPQRGKQAGSFSYRQVAHIVNGQGAAIVEL